jgi:predicted dehydrogenase
MTVRWGFLGAGGIATKALGPAVQAADGAVLHAAGARDAARAQRLGPVRAYGSYDEVLADPDVDAVYVALNNDAHRPWTLKALEAGKHVLCEKPLGTSVAEVEEMTAAAERAGRLLVEASWYRWHPRTRAAAARLADIGPVTHVAAGFTFDGVPEGDFRLDPTRGGGALYDVGCYAVSAALWAVGRGLPDEVAAQLLVGPTGVDLDARLVLDWDGATAEVRGGIASGDGQWLVITGERGELELRGQAFANWHEPSELWVSDGTGTERVPFGAVDAYRLMVEEVSAAVEGRGGWLLPLEESRQNAAVLAAAFASGRDGGRPVAP